MVKLQAENRNCAHKLDQIYNQHQFKQQPEQYYCIFWCWLHHQYKHLRNLQEQLDLLPNLQQLLLLLQLQVIICKVLIYPLLLQEDLPKNYLLATIFLVEFKNVKYYLEQLLLLYHGKEVHNFLFLFRVVQLNNISIYHGLLLMCQYHN